MNVQPPQRPHPYQQPGQGFPPPMIQFEQWQIQAELAKSYTTRAIITVVLYFTLWIPGLIANIVFLLEANKTKQITGRTPVGYGCLVAMLWVFGALSVLSVLIVAYITLILRNAVSMPH